MQIGLSRIEGLQSVLMQVLELCGHWFWPTPVRRASIRTQIDDKELTCAPNVYCTKETDTESPTRIGKKLYIRTKAEPRTLCACIAIGVSTEDSNGHGDTHDKTDNERVGPFGKAAAFE